jgi:hypothetical protein
VVAKVVPAEVTHVHARVFPLRDIKLVPRRSFQTSLLLNAGKSNLKKAEL